MLKKSLAVWAAVLATLSLTAATPAFADSSQPTSQQIQSLQQSVNQWVSQRAGLIHWDLTGVTDTLVDSQTSSDTVTATFNVTEEHLLAYASPADVPIMQGLQAGMSEASAADALSANALQVGNAYIRVWQQQLEDYITTPQEENLTIEAQATLNPDGTIAPNSTQLLWLNATSGAWVPVSQILVAIPTAAQVEESAQEGMAKQLAAIQTNSAAPQGVCSGSCYNWSAAVTYANEYTSTATVACPGTSDNNNQNLSYYNPSYSHIDCTDCANYVSQALAAGGIPETSSWEPYSNAWVGVPDLVSYMTGADLWVTTTKTAAAAGATITLVIDKVANAHVMMVVYNDGTTMDVSAHTSDQRANPYTGADSPTYYAINY